MSGDFYADFAVVIFVGLGLYFKPDFGGLPFIAKTGVKMV